MLARLWVFGVKFIQNTITPYWFFLGRAVPARIWLIQFGQPVPPADRRLTRGTFRVTKSGNRRVGDGDILSDGKT